MALLTKAVRGTGDLLPGDSYKWQAVEKLLMETAETYGFRAIRTPVFEHTELFQRSVGDTTDVVQKEMYTFEDKGGRSITLRPEGTAGAARSILEHGLYSGPLPVKVSYLTSCYRYEKPQAGRLREFHQFGIELFGGATPTADAEVISVAHTAFRRLGLKNIALELNSIGCPVCRAEFQKALTAHFESHKEELCETCLGRLEKNPMRILDCKSPNCGEIAAGAPTVLEYLCGECAAHFDAVQANLKAAEISFTINPRIVRGLDYYTRTVFEFVSREIGTQGTVCGGGRYDGLIEELGGPHLPSLGFALGLERLMMLLEKQGIELPDAPKCLLYIAGVGDEAQREAYKTTMLLRDEGFYTECDVVGRSLKAQMKYADKLGARFSMVLGEDELKTGKGKLKDMKTGEQREVELGAELKEVLYDVTLGDLSSAISEMENGDAKNFLSILMDDKQDME